MPRLRSRHERPNSGFGPRVFPTEAVDIRSGNQRIVLSLFAVAACFVASACGASSQTATTTTRVPALAGKAAVFDDVEIDEAAQRLYVADRTDKGIDVFDVSGTSAKFLTTVALPDTPNGLAVAPALDRVFAGTNAGAVEIVDTTAGKVVSEVKTGAKEVDLLDVAPVQDLLFASTGAGGSVVTIDAQTGQVISTTTVGKPLEQPRFDATDGMVYVSVPDLDALAVIDPRAGVVKKTLKLGGCIPRGLAIKPGAGMALVACRNTVMSVDLRTGQTNSMGNVGDADVVQYYPSVDRFFAAAPHSPQPAMIGMFGGDPVGFLGSAFINGGGNAVVYDGKTDILYTTDFRASSAGLTGFHMDGARPVPLWQTAVFVIGPLALLGLLIAPIWWFIGRKADPINRKQRTQQNTPAVVLSKPKVEP
jgi:DNA-binding beta-propeller fold protein YncE